MRYQLAGKHPEHNAAITIELGWDAATGYYFGVDQADVEIDSGAGIWTLTELIDITRQWIPWDRRLYQAMRDAPFRQYVEDNPGAPTTKILEAVR